MIHFHRGKFGEGDVCLDPAAPAFRYGAGFFETVCYNGRTICHLAAHLDRLFHSLRIYGIPFETVDFHAVILEVLERNGLLGSMARVNIFYPMEGSKARPVILAAPFEAKPYKAYRACLCADRHVSSLNSQKTTSYMFFHLAWKKAKARGFDDAVLLDFQDNVLECTTGAILVEKGGVFHETDSPYRLPSTALALARTVLDIERTTIPLRGLTTYDHAYLLNSMIGMRPLVTIGETAFVPDEEACRTVTMLVQEDELLETDQ